MTLALLTLLATPAWRLPFEPLGLQMPVPFPRKMPGAVELEGEEEEVEDDTASSSTGMCMDAPSSQDIGVSM